MPPIIGERFKQIRGLEEELEVRLAHRRELEKLRCDFDFADQKETRE